MIGSVSWALQRAFELYPDELAAIDGETRLTYRELERRVGALDAGLAGLGVGRGDVVAVLALNSHRHLECWFAIPRSGAVLNDLNVRLAPAELEFILKDCEAVALVVDDAFAEAGRSLAERCPTVQHTIYAGSGEVPEGMTSYEELVAGPTRPAAADVGDDDLAGIFYTGGTTGLPKGVMLSHSNLVNNAKHVMVAFGYRQSDRYLHAAPMFHLADGASTFALTWMGGAHVTVPAFDPELVARTIQAEQVTVGVLVPTMINLLLNHPCMADCDLSSLRRIMYGASPMPAELQRKAMEAIPCEWMQGYGMTEAAPLVSILGPEEHRLGAAGEEPHARRLRSAGLPVPGVQAEVRREDGSRAAPGEPGEIWVRGPNVMQGYWRREEETAAALDAEGWYHTGDAAYADESGYLFIVDRVKDMIVSGGENVYSTEVENAIYQHPAVLEAAVFGVPDERWGERVHAAVVLHDGQSVTQEELVEHCRSLIAGYKLPRSVEFRSEPLPKSGAGKILKRELREAHWEGQERRVS